MKQTIVVAAIAASAAALAAFGWATAQDGPRHAIAPIAGAAVSQTDNEQHGPKLKEDTKKSLGVFDRGKGRTLRLLTADTTDGGSCLIEERSESVAGATCLDGGLFGARKVAFSVNSHGGPDPFAELYVAGVVAPGIRAVSLSKSDGTFVRVPLNAERAFLVESPAAELLRDVLPVGLTLFGGNGKLVETVEIPAVR